MHYPSSFEQIDALYPGVCLLTLKQVAKILNRAEQTIRHQRQAGKFPIPDAPASRYRKPLFRKVDIAAFVDGGVITPITTPAPSTTALPKRGRGRPKNTEASPSTAL